MAPRNLVVIAIISCACSKSSRTVTPAVTQTPSAPSQQGVATPKAAVPAVGSTQPAAAGLEVKSLPLPGATGPVGTDYIAYDRRRARVWVPVADTGSVDLFDIASGAFTRIDGFKTTEQDTGGNRRKRGPSAVAVGDGVVYIGNRATGEVCPVDDANLKLGSCLQLPTQTDGVAYVASAKEAWVTTPRDGALAVLDASRPSGLKPKLVIKTPGKPEGYAVDEAHGLFYTNLEDKNRTLAINIQTHAIKANWAAGCGDDGPRGVAVDSERQFVFVACTSGVVVLDGAHGGTKLGSLVTGAGVQQHRLHRIQASALHCCGQGRHAYRRSR